MSLSYFGNGEVTVGPLAAGASTTVSFTEVSLSGDQCYFFQVIADCDDVVSESNEYNNAKSEYHQIGYVIVVMNNADLIAEADRVEGGTYYIEDRTITNCAGNGITIADTTLPFVINNCNVRYCGYGGGDGIYMYNVNNGKVTGSTVYDTYNGISVDFGLTNVEITDNSIYDNSCGIKVGA